MAGIHSRKAVLQLLLRVLAQQYTAEAAMAETPEFVVLEGQDRAFAAHMLMQILRYRGALEAVLAQYLDKPMKAARLDIHACLLMGAAQLLLMDVPDHAAVDTSVTLAKSVFKPLSGLVNAVLKRVAKEGKGQWEVQTPEKRAQLNTPQWLYRSWQKAYGEESTTAIARAHLELPPLDISLKDGGASAEWAEKLGAEVILPGSLRLRNVSGSVRNLEGFAEGGWWVQDVSASLPVRLLGDVRGKRVLDLCAAPGGKTAQLAAIGAEVVAVDQSGERLERLRENLTRLNLSAEIIEADIMHWQPEEKFDAILLDAPCSATGTIRRHPELVWQRQAEDITRLVDIQRALLARASDWLTPSGILVYASCSLQPEEGELQISRFLRDHAFMVDLGAVGRAALPHEWSDPQGWVRTLPYCMEDRGGMDGFFAVALIRC